MKESWIGMAMAVAILINVPLNSFHRLPLTKMPQKPNAKADANPAEIRP